MYQAIEIKTKKILMLHRNKDFLINTYRWRLADREVKIEIYKPHNA